MHGARPAENEAVLRRMVFVREDQTYPDFKVRHALRVASWFYPNWNAELAEERPGGLPRLLPPRVGGDDLALDEVADHPPEVLLLGGEDVAPHYAAASSRCITGEYGSRWTQGKRGG